MSARRQQFVQEYLVDLNATQAAIRAGFSKKSAGIEGARLLKNAKIKAEIAAALDARTARTEVTQDYVLENLTEVVERCMERAPVMVRRGKEMVQLEDDEGRDVWQFDARGAVGGLTLLGKHLGLFNDRVVHSGSVATADVTAGLTTDQRKAAALALLTGALAR